MNSRLPKLSILTVVWNGASTLQHCIESVRAQSYPRHKIEHIVVDGGSTDGTLEILDRHRAHLGRVVSEPDEGLYDAMNKGIGLATGDVLGILNVDDFYPHPGVLAQIADVMSRDGVDACYGDLNYVDSSDLGRVCRSWRSGSYDLKSFYWGWMPPHPTVFVRKRVYQTCGTFSLEFGTAADYELMLRFFLKHKIHAAYIPEVLVHMRNGGASNASLMGRIRANLMDRKAWRANGLKPYPWTLWLKPLRKVGQHLQWHADPR